MFNLTMKGNIFPARIKNAVVTPTYKSDKIMKLIIIYQLVLFNVLAKIFEVVLNQTEISSSQQDFPVDKLLQMYAHFQN